MAEALVKKPSTRATMQPANWQQCVVCGATFPYSAERYEELGIMPPLRCQTCRRARTRRLVQTQARVIRVGTDFAFVEAETGEQLFVGVSTMAPELMRALRPNDVVAVTVDPEERPSGSRRRRCFDCRKLRVD